MDAPRHVNDYWLVYRTTDGNVVTEQVEASSDDSAADVAEGILESRQIKLGHLYHESATVLDFVTSLSDPTEKRQGAGHSSRGQQRRP